MPRNWAVHYGRGLLQGPWRSAGHTGRQRAGWSCWQVPRAALRYAAQSAAATKAVGDLETSSVMGRCMLRCLLLL